MNPKAVSLLARVRRVTATRRGLLIILILSLGLFLLSRMAKSPIPSEVRTGSNSLPGAVGGPAARDADLKAEWQRLKDPSRIIPPNAAPHFGLEMSGMVDGSGTPLISHAAELAVTTKDFSRSRSNLAEILERHHGYASKLRMVGQPGGSTLTATLRVPSSEFNSAVSDFKTLGSVEREEQTADEVTEQQADLDARLTNARNTLQRLQGMSPKSVSPVDIERQLLAVGSEIARLETQRTAWQNRTIFANVLFSLREEIVPPPVESLATQFRKAALAGLADAVSSLSGIVLFVVSYSPAILVWTLLLFLPGRWIWRKWLAGGEPEARSVQST
jgi:Domain of unknown function (DUF4349)